MSGVLRFIRRSLVGAAGLVAAIVVTTVVSAQEADPSLKLDLPDDPNAVDLGLDDAESGDYKSRTVGRKQRWQLDTGHIDSEAQDPAVKESAEDSSFSGFRLKRPRKY